MRQRGYGQEKKREREIKRKHYMGMAAGSLKNVYVTSMLYMCIYIIYMFYVIYMIYIYINVIYIMCHIYIYHIYNV